MLDWQDVRFVDIVILIGSSLGFFCLGYGLKAIKTVKAIRKVGIHYVDWTGEAWWTVGWCVLAFVLIVSMVAVIQAYPVERMLEDADQYCRRNWGRPCVYSEAEALK